MRSFFVIAMIISSSYCKAIGFDSLVMPIHVLCYDGKRDCLKEVEVSLDGRRAEFSDTVQKLFSIKVPYDSAVNVEVSCPGFKTARFIFFAHPFSPTEWMNVQLDKEGCRYMLFGKNIVPLWPDSMRIGIGISGMEKDKRQKLNSLMDSLGLMFTADTARTIHQIGSDCIVPFSACVKKNGQPFGKRDEDIRVLSERGFAVGNFMGNGQPSELYTFPLTVKQSNYVTVASIQKTLDTLHLKYQYRGDSMSVMPDDLSIGLGFLDIMDELNNSGQIEYSEMNGWDVICLD